MHCPRCQHENPPPAKFCLECGSRLAPTCAQCGTVLPAGAKFCLECGKPLDSSPGPSPAPPVYTPRHLAEKILTSRSALEGERKQVTVLFADLKGSMELLADRDAEEARKLLDPVLEHMMEAVHRYEGTVNQVMGDGIMALFGAPLAHEDHAVRACYAAIDLQAALRRHAEEIWRTQGVKVQVRVGLNSGEVVVRAIGSDLRMDYSAVGQTTHLAARMEQCHDQVSERDRSTQTGDPAAGRTGAGRRLGGEPERRQEPARGVGLDHGAEDPARAAAAARQPSPVSSRLGVSEVEPDCPQTAVSCRADTASSRLSRSKRASGAMREWPASRQSRNFS